MQPGSMIVSAAQDDSRVLRATRVLLVEDHTVVREAIAASFDAQPDFEVAGQAGSLADARWQLGWIDLAGIDLGLPDGDGADLIAELRRVNPDAHALVLTAALDRANLARAVELGAAAVLDKAAHLDEVQQAARRVCAGETLIPADEVVQLLGCARRVQSRERLDRAAIAELTAREREVLQALSEGLDARVTAERFTISIRTLRNHIASICQKLGVHSQLQALVFALRYGVVDVPKGPSPGSVLPPGSRPAAASGKAMLTRVPSPGPLATSSFAPSRS